MRGVRYMLGTLLLCGLASTSGAGCSEDESKQTRPQRDSLGSEIFGVLCDRVGAQSLREDLSGASYNTVCHGQALKVDAGKLPPAADPLVRERGIAKIEALARHRTDLIAALDTVFPDDKVTGKDLSNPDPSRSCDPKPNMPRREQLRGLLTRFLPTENNEVLPESSRALADTIKPLTQAEGDAARLSMTYLSARRGYMSPALSGGILGGFLGAPRLRDTLGATMRLFSPDSTPYDRPNTMGPGHDVLVQFIGAVQEDLAQPVTEEPRLKISYDAPSGRTLLSRPRTTLELAREVLLTQSDVFSNGPPLLVVRRDFRGMASVAKVDGKVPAPFVDADNDGTPDLDTFGRFAAAPGATISDPFVGDKRDGAYEYIDARATAASALLRHLAPLADPDNGNEALLSSFEALEPMLRPGAGREALLDLVHAVGQIMADSSTDETLALVGTLVREKPQLIARLTGSLLDAKTIIDAHPEAKLPEGSTLIDDLLDWVVKVSKEPFLLEEVLGSMADNRAPLLQKALPSLLMFKDRLSYDPADLNGPPLNKTTNTKDPPKTPVDRKAPITEWNRSIFMRFLQMISDSRGVTACNKQGAVLRAKMVLNPGEPPTDVPFPFDCIEGSTCEGAPECSIFKVDNLSLFYLRSMVGAASLHLRNEFLTENSSPQLIQDSTGLTGLWPTPKGQDIKPRPQFLNRLVFFNLVDNLPPTAPNFLTNRFINDLQGSKIGSSVCPERIIDDPNIGEPDVAPDGKIRGLRACTDGSWLPQRSADTIFAFEHNSGYDSMAPLVEIFVKHKKEELLLDLLQGLDKHWRVPNGVVTAEPAAAELFATDIVASLSEITKVLKSQTVVRCAPSDKTACTNPKTIPAAVALADGVRALLDPAKAAANEVTDRRGNKTLKNGKPVTLFGLVRDALDAEDQFMASDPARNEAWKKARSRIIDEFLTVDGRGKEAKFHDPGIPFLLPIIVDLSRSQRLAECKGSPSCKQLRSTLAKDLETALDKKVVQAGLDLFDVILADKNARLELGRMTAYLTRQQEAWGVADKPPAPSTTPFTTPERAPGALEQSIVALVDGLGALGDLHDIRPLYPMLSHALSKLDPQLALLSRLNQRAYDSQGHEICAKEVDPDEIIKTTLSRLGLVVSPPGRPKRTALQIFVDAITEVNRVDAANTGPLDPEDYAHVFTNIHELLTDPKSGLEQLYASVKNATDPNAKP